MGTLSLIGTLLSIVGGVSAILALPRLVRSRPHETRALIAVVAAAACVAVTFVPTRSNIANYSCGTLWSKRNSASVGEVNSSVPLQCSYTTSYLLLLAAAFFLVVAGKEVQWLTHDIADAWKSMESSSNGSDSS
jgi:hypothetical protein